MMASMVGLNEASAESSQPDTLGCFGPDFFGRHKGLNVHFQDSLLGLWHRNESCDEAQLNLHDDLLAPYKRIDHTTAGCSHPAP